MPEQPLRKSILLILLSLFCATLASCQVTYPANTLTQKLSKLAKEETGLQVSAHITGKTLWVYVPLDNLVKEKDMGWDEKGLEKVGQVLSIVHRVILSTDANLDFAVTVASDVKNFGIQLATFEHLPDVRQAILEKFSRGEFFMRSLKDITYNPAAVGDTTGESMQYYDVTFNRFLGMQVIHRVKSLFLKDKTLGKIFEIKSSSLNEKFGVIKIDLEFLKKTYVLTPEEEKIKPLDYVKMIAAKTVKGYDYTNFQAFELKDTFSGETALLNADDLRKIKINLPEFSE